MARLRETYMTDEFVTLSQVVHGLQVYEDMPVVVDPLFRSQIWIALGIQMMFLALAILIPYEWFEYGVAPSGFFSLNIGLGFLNGVLHLFYSLLPILQIGGLIGLFGTLFLITQSKEFMAPISEFQHYLAAIYIFQAGASILSGAVTFGLFALFVFVYGIIWLVVIAVGCFIAAVCLGALGSS